MKKNNKGFFLAETIVVIALVATVMAFVYPNVTKLYDNYKNRTLYYDQTEDLYVLKAYSELLSDKINKNSCSDASSGKCIIDNSAAIDGNTFGCKEFSDGNIDANSKNLFDGSGLGGLQKLYMTGYMSTLSSSDYNFNKYLRRLKKTSNDTSSYRLIGVFDGGRYASIKIDNPNPNRNCNLGG